MKQLPPWTRIKDRCSRCTARAEYRVGEPMRPDIADEAPVGSTVTGEQVFLKTMPIFADIDLDRPSFLACRVHDRVIGNEIAARTGNAVGVPLKLTWKQWRQGIRE